MADLRRRLSLRSIEESIELDGAPWGLTHMRVPHPDGGEQVVACEDQLIRVPIQDGMQAMVPFRREIAPVDGESPLVCIIRGRVRRRERTNAIRKAEAHARLEREVGRNLDDIYGEMRRDLRKMAGERVTVDLGAQR